MSAPDGDANVWYALYVVEDKTSSLLSASVYDRGGTTGAAFFNATDHTAVGQRWQLFPMNSTTFFLRTQDGGSNAFWVPNPPTRMASSPLLWRGDVADAAVLWQFGAWDVEAWYLWNGINGTRYHLAKSNAGAGNGICMNDSIAAPQNRQRRMFDKSTAINDPKFSIVNVCLLHWSGFLRWIDLRYSVRQQLFR
jgi:hypothetical protein